MVHGLFLFVFVSVDVFGFVIFLRMFSFFIHRVIIVESASGHSRGGRYIMFFGNI